MKLLHPTSVNCVSGGKIDIEIKSKLINDELSEACLSEYLSVSKNKPYLTQDICSINEQISFMNSVFEGKVISISEI
ncbi:MAG: hypothetical protein U1E78_03000 [Gammaproteobacteria bacterium]